MSELNKLVIVGAGFGGIGCALQARRLNPGIDIVLVEKSNRILPWIDRKGLTEYPLGTTAVVLPDTRNPDKTRGPADSLLQKWDPPTLLDWLGSPNPDEVEVHSGSILMKNPKRLRGILDPLLQHHRIEIETDFAMESISLQGEAGFRIWSREGRVHRADRLVLATGGERNHAVMIVTELGAVAIPPVAGFVRLKTASRQYGERIGPLERVVGIRCAKTGTAAMDLIKISSRGLEGPAVSRLSMEAGRTWHDLDYSFPVEIDWLPDYSPAQVIRELLGRKQVGGRRLLADTPMFGFSKRSWCVILRLSKIDLEASWSRVRIKKLQSLAHRLKSESLNVSGMGLPDGERAWAGGIDFACLDHGKLELKSVPGLFFAGEVIDFIGPPGGHHQDLVWASSAIAAQAAAATT